MSLFSILPAIISSIAAALKFVSTNAHFRYHDLPKPYWQNLTAVDIVAKLTQEKVTAATVYTVPGTIAHWNDGPPAWAAWKLP